MAFKMRGFPMQATSALKATVPPPAEEGRQRKLKKGELLKTEHKDTWVDKSKSITRQIEDLEQRISFIKEDISNQDEGATAKQNRDIAAMEKRLAKLRDQRDKDQDKYSQLNPKNPDRD
jgi:septal ring factor EnvC (AmiA/AmiB activator)